MAVTIPQRPQGQIIDTTVRGNTQGINSSGVLELQGSVTDLSTNDWIYMVSTVDEYNGFWQVSKTGASSMKLIVPSGGFVAFIKDIDSESTPPRVGNDKFNYYATSLTHGWSAVHLPITYRLSNDLYPVNSVDTTRNINSVQDLSGFTVLQLSGSLGSIHTYDFVKLTLPSDTDLSGVYQIVEFVSPTVLIINMPYDNDNNFTSATALKHYNNYNIIVRVYAGINASHQWTAQKPYELAATIKYIPDDNNEAFFSINELLKSYIETRNNLLLGTLPNNIDFWNNFYIEVAESYDDSDGYVFGTFTSSFTSDLSTFQGMSVNAKLLFKNIYSGYMSAYLMTNTTAKFLTLFTIPVLFGCSADLPDCYQDISFIVPYNYTSVVLFKQFYLNGVLITSSSDSLGTLDQGVMRAPLEADCDYDRVDLQIRSTPVLQNGSFALTLSPAQSVRTGNQWEWSAAFSGMAFVILPSSIAETAHLQIPYHTTAGKTYTFEITVRQEDGGGGAGNYTNLNLYLTDNVDLTNIVTHGNLPLGNTIFQISATATEDMPYIQITLQANNVPGYDREGGILLIEDVSTGIEVNSSETKQFKIDCGCATQELNLTWLNNLGGFDYWHFTAKKDDIVEIREAMETKKNILPDWPKSYGADADTIRKQTVRVSNKAYTVRSQHITEDELTAISYIKSSVLVQIINSRNDRRTVLVDTDSFIVRKDGDKTHEIALNISFTDDIPSQTV